MPRAEARVGIADGLILLAAAALPFVSPWLTAAVYLTPALAECCRAGGRRSAARVDGADRDRQADGL